MQDLEIQKLNVLARLDSDLYEIFDAIVERRLDGMEIKWKKEKACYVFCIRRVSREV